MTQEAAGFILGLESRNVLGNIPLNIPICFNEYTEITNHKLNTVTRLIMSDSKSLTEEQYQERVKNEAKELENYAWDLKHLVDKHLKEKEPEWKQAPGIYFMDIFNTDKSNLEKERVENKSTSVVRGPYTNFTKDADSIVQLWSGQQDQDFIRRQAKNYQPNWTLFFIRFFQSNGVGQPFDVQATLVTASYGN